MLPNTELLNRIERSESRQRAQGSSPTGTSVGSKPRPVKSILLRDEDGGVYEAKVKAGSWVLTRVG